MSKIEQRWLEIRQLDDLAAGDSIIHRLHPGAKLLTTLAFVLVTASFPKYAVTAMLPLILFPLFLISLADLPWGVLFGRLLLSLPFVLFVGIFNPLFDQTLLYQFGPIALTGGVVSFFSILLRFFLSVLAAVSLLATTGINPLGAALQSLGVPSVLVNQILSMYRYLHVLVDEVARTLRACSLRSYGGEAVGFRVWGSLTGGLLLRTLDRAQRVYQAMLCRGFDGRIRLTGARRMNFSDFVFILSWTAFFLLVRCYDLPMLLGKWLIGS